jgi:hypothetical protein
METFESRRRTVFSPRLIAGLAFITAGALLALDRFTALDIGPLWRYWPLILVAVGVAKLVEPSAPRFPGLIPLGLGIVFLGNNFDWWFLRFHDLFPFVILAIGLLILGRAIWGPAWRRRHCGDGSSQINA